MSRALFVMTLTMIASAGALNDRRYFIGRTTREIRAPEGTPSVSDRGREKKKSRDIITTRFFFFVLFFPTITVISIFSSAEKGSDDNPLRHSVLRGVSRVFSQRV